jgi:outer membrane protein assembly factor BamA
MQALGYLDAQTETTTGSDGQPLLLPVPGSLYGLGYVAVEGISGAIPEFLQTNLRLRTERHLGEPARADTIADIRRDVLRVFQESSFATPAVVAVEIREYPSTMLAGLHISVEPGQQASFGDVILVGDGSLSEISPAAHLNGNPYDPDAVDNLRTDIQDSGLFRRISVSVQPRDGDPALVDVVAELKRNNRAEEDLAAHGLVGFSILLACGSLLILRQVALATSAGREYRSLQVADIALALALSAGAFFALDRVVFLIG